MRALDALLVHPQITRIHGEIVARSAGTDHHHAAALDDEYRYREDRLARVLEHHIDIVAFAGYRPDGLAEIAHAFDPFIVLGRADLRHLSPAGEILAVDDALGAERHDEIALVIIG